LIPQHNGFRPAAAYWALVALLPVVVLWHDSYALYGPPWVADAWFYTGYFRSLPDFKRDLFYALYYGTRLPWILPGWAAHSLFPAVAANAILHLTAHLAATLSFFSVLNSLVGRRVALLATIAFSVNPWFLGETGSDYIDGPAMAFGLLAMALLVRAATAPPRYWSLAGAGASLACMLFSQPFCALYVPACLLLYGGVVLHRHPKQWRGALVRLVIGVSAGFIAATLMLCSINYWIDGIFRLFASSVAQSSSLSGRWPKDPIRPDGRLLPWLWPAAAGMATCLLLLPWRVREALRREPAGLLLSLQLLMVAGAIAWLHLRGIAVLNQHTYAAFLLPFIFLVMGEACFAGAQRMSPRGFTALCGAELAALAALWYNPRLPWLNSIEPAALVGAVLLCGGLLLRTRVAGTWLAAAAFTALSAVMMAQTARLNGGNHAEPEQYRRIMATRDRIEKARNGRPIRFWFNRSEPNFYDYFALSSLYLHGYSLLGEGFPGGCEAGVAPETLVVATSQVGAATEVARMALANCWQPFGMVPVIESTETVPSPRGPYTVAMLRAERVPARWQALRAVFDGDAGRLEAAPGDATLPLDRWKADPYVADPPELRREGESLAVRTPKSQTFFAARYATLTAPFTGRYRFELHGRSRFGQLAFGARSADDQRYLVADVTGRRTGDRVEYGFWVALEKGQGMLPRLANNAVSGLGAASIVIDRITVHGIPAAE
jgi:4-amino-4-deoxy-L-arabinose transferase-like glycosyltransferase